MASFEDEFVYSMMLRDSLCALPPQVRQFADTTTWPQDVNEKAKRGSTYQRRTKPIIGQLAPAVEEGLHRPMFDLKDPLDHQIDLERRSGRLVHNLVAATRACKQNLGPFMANGSGWEPSMVGLGNMVHFIIDIWNPFSLVTHNDDVDRAAAYFMQSLKLYHEDLPFFWAHVDKDMTEILNKSTYLDILGTTLEAERCRDMYYLPIGNRYLFGNGFPAARDQVREWYNSVVNAIGRAVWYCAS